MGVTLSGRRGWWWEGGAWGPTGREEDRQRLGQGARQGGLRRGGCWPSLPEAWGAVLDLAWSPQGLQGSSLKARKDVANHSYQGRLWPAQISLEGYFLSGPLPPCSHISHTPLLSHNLLSHLFSHSATSITPAPSWLLPVIPIRLTQLSLSHPLSSYILLSLLALNHHHHPYCGGSFFPKMATTIYLIIHALLAL